MEAYETSFTLHDTTDLHFRIEVYDTQAEMIEGVEELTGATDKDLGACVSTPIMEQVLGADHEKRYRFRSTLFFNAEEFEKFYLGHEAYHAGHNIHVLLKQLSPDSNDMDELERPEETAADITGYLTTELYGQVLRKIQKMQREKAK